MLSLLQHIVLPPASLLLALAIGLFLLLSRRHARAGAILVAAGLAASYLLSCPFVAAALLQGLQTATPISADRLVAGEADEIVVLSGDVGYYPDLDAAAVGPITLARARYGAVLSRRTGLPILVAGGMPLDCPTGDGAPGCAESYAGQMKRLLTEEFGANEVLTEDRSADTWENAAFSAAILLPMGRKRIFLVTNAWHMPRAALAFSRAGFSVIPAPMGALPPPRWRMAGFLPSAKAMLYSYYALHEMAGWGVYSLR